MPQRGEDFGERLVNAHLDAGAVDGAVVQIGMDTPQVTAADLTAVDGRPRPPTRPCSATHRTAAGGRSASAGPAAAAALRGVPMSTPTTGADTRVALEAAGLAVGSDDGARRRRHRRRTPRPWPALAPHSRFAAAWRGRAAMTETTTAGHCIAGTDPSTPPTRPCWRTASGPTLDVGCGPGRMSAHLARQGRLVLGVDLVKDAVTQAVERGATALHRDVFAPLPGEGRWQTALLADGNIGIGGDPVALLRRVAAVIAPAAGWSSTWRPRAPASTTGWVRLETERGTSRPLRWAWVGVDAIDRAGRRGRAVAWSTPTSTTGRWFAVLARAA